MARDLTDSALFWNARAEVWSESADDPDSFYTRRTKWICEIVKRHLDRGTVLDVGCGPGLLVCELHRAGYEVWGTDISPDMIDRAIDRAPTADGMPLCHFAVCTETSLPFARRFDAITAIGVFPYVSDYAAHLTLMSDYVSPGGILVASSTNRFSLYTFRELLSHLSHCRRSPEWGTVALNLIRTGVWSGGNVEYSSSQQCYSAASFDRLCRLHSFKSIDSLDLFHVDRLDAFALRRGVVMRSLAQHFGWTHIGVYRKQCL